MEKPWSAEHQFSHFLFSNYCQCFFPTTLFPGNHMPQFSSETIDNKLAVNKQFCLQALAAEKKTEEHADHVLPWVESFLNPCVQRELLPFHINVQSYFPSMFMCRLFWVMPCVGSYWKWDSSHGVSTSNSCYLPHHHHRIYTSRGVHRIYIFNYLKHDIQTKAALSHDNSRSYLCFMCFCQFMYSMVQIYNYSFII